MGSTIFWGYLTTVLLVSLLIVSPPASASDVAGAQSAEDREFVEWYNNTMGKIVTDTMTMASAIENYDCKTAEAGANSGYAAAMNALYEIEDYEVSAEMQPVKENLKLALANLKEACYHTELGAMLYDADELETAARYVNSSSHHFEEIDGLGMVPPTPVAALKKLHADLESAVQILGSAKTPSPSPTPEIPSYEAIFAVGNIVAVAYLVLRMTRY